MNAKLIELQGQRDQLALEKRELETKLTAIRNLIRASGRMSNDKYQECCKAQSQYAAKIVNIEAKLLPLKTQIRVLSELDHDSHTVRYNNMGAKDVVLMLREVRDKWQEFSADDALGTSTERTLAAQFVRDLNPVIHCIINA